MNKQPAYEASHPVAVALGGMVRALRSGADLLEALAGQPYCRALDLYVDRETKRRADALGSGMAHLAFLPA